MDQLIDHALTTINQTGLYKTACMEWEALSEVKKTWPNLKNHYVEAYESRLQSGSGTVTQHGYHGAANANES